MLGHDRRILAAGRRREAIAETGAHHLRRVFVEVDVDALPLLHEQRAQIVDAVGVVGVLVGVEDAVEPIDLGIEKLLAHIGRRIHQDACDAAGVVPLDQKRGAPPAILRILRIAGAPAQGRTRHAAGRPAAEDGEFQGHAE